MRTTECIGTEQTVTQAPDVMSGTPVFAGTRVPVKTLWDHLAGGVSVDQFLEDYPTVSRAQVLTVIQIAGERLLNDLAGAELPEKHARSPR